VFRAAASHPCCKMGSVADNQIMQEIMGSRVTRGAKSVMDFKRFKPDRVKVLIDGGNQKNKAAAAAGGKSVVYWMHRDQRVQDNWAMLYAQKLALENGAPLHVASLLTATWPRDPGATFRSYSFCIGGLKEVEAECRDLNIAFHVLTSEADDDDGKVRPLLKLLCDLDVGWLVADMSPLRPHRNMLASLRKAVQGGQEAAASFVKGFSLYQVDARNIIPVWTTSQSQEKGAFTIRSKVMSRLNDYATEFPPVVNHPHRVVGSSPAPVDWERVAGSLSMDQSVKPVEWAVPGAKAGLQTLANFVSSRMGDFGEFRNDPNADAQSNMSPWFHFGQVSPHRALLYIRQHCDTNSDSVIGFIEQLTVRRELGDNFCYYSGGGGNYDRLEGAPDWAKKTLNEHRYDKRSHTYSLEEFEKAATHDRLWNAAQQQLLQVGKIHGYMRMYWAKMILQWTSSPEEAMKIAVYLNDHYSLDGCDANGYNGIMWSIGGIHDKSFHEQPVFGKVRGMSYNGCTKKFDVGQYVARFCGSSNGQRSQQPKNWKFKDRKAAAAAAALQATPPGNASSSSQPPRQPVKVFVPSKNSRRDWTY